MIRILAIAGAGALVLLGPARALDAQELTLKRELPPVEDTALCAGMGGADPPEASEADRVEAERLAGDAARAMILGETAEARELLEEAAALDPAAPAIRFQLARVLEEAGEESAALEAFCRYIALAPDGPERSEAEARAEALSTPPEDEIPEPARRAFTEGVEHFDRGEWDQAVREFSRALVEHPNWGDAHYNRGLAYLRAGREGAGLSDLEQYLELRPDGSEAGRVRARLEVASPPPASLPNPATAFAVGMLMPGMGHFYSGRAGWGTLYLVGAGAGAAAGLLYRRVEVACRTIPGPDGCPPDQIAEERETQPFLVPGLAGAAGLTLLGALHAYLGARGGSQGSGASAMQLHRSDDGSSTLSVEPSLEHGVPAVRAIFRLSF